MKKTPLFASTLIAAATAFSFSALPAWADTVYLPTETQSSDSPTASSGVIVANDYAINNAEGATQGWISPWPTGAAGGNTNLSFADGTTFSGEGLIGIFFNQGDGSNVETVDLTNVNATNFSGQLIVLNNWDNETDVKILGETWANVEYLFANAVDDTTLAEKYGLTGITRGDLNNSLGSKGLEDILALQGDTTFAGITGATKGATGTGTASDLVLCEHETITVASNGQTLTIAGADTYAFYGTAGTESARLSLTMNSSDGTGKQTFGGTNYLQDVIVTAGTLALDGTTSIAGSVSVAASSTLELGGEITLGSTISNSGTIIIDDGTTFVLDNLTSGHVEGTIIGYYEIVKNSGGSITYTEDGTYTFVHNGTTLSDWNIYVDENGNVYVYGEVGEFTWNGTNTNNTWSTSHDNQPWSIGTDGDSSYFVNGSDVTFGTITDGSPYNVVNISETLTAGSIAVNDNYTFVFANGIKVEAGYVDVASGKTLTLQLADGASSAEFHMDGETWYQFFSNANSRENHGTVYIGEGVTFYLSDSTDSATIGSSNYGAVVTGTGTLSVETNGEIGLYLPGFEGTVEFRSGTVRIGHDNNYGDTGVFNSKATLQFDSGVGITLVGSSSVEVSAKLVFAEGSHTIATGNVTAAEFSGAIDAANATITKSGSGTITFSGTDVNIGTLSVSNGNITFTGTATIGTFNTASNGNAAGNTIALEENASLTVGSIANAWGSNFTLADGSVLTVTGTTSFAPGSTARTVSGSGTFNTEKLSLSNYANYTFEGVNLNIGSGGIVSEGSYTGWTNNHLTFGDGLTVGVYGGTDGTNKSWSTDATITFSGSVTFKTESEENITLSGTLSGDGFSNEGSGTLTLSGTVDVSSSIQNSGTIVVDSNIMIVLDNLEADSNGTYVVITNTGGGTIEGWSSLTKDNFSLTGAEITYIDISESGQVTIVADVTNLIWNASGGSGTWDTSTANWTSDGATVAFNNGDNVTFDGSTGNGTVTVQSDGVETASVTVSGGTYSFAGGNITVVGDFTIGTGAEVDLNSGNSTIYGDVVVEGTLKLAGSGGESGEIHGTITINEGGYVELDVNDATGYSDGVTSITINAGGTLYVNTTANETLGSCDLILVGGTIDGISGSNLDLYSNSSLIVKAAEGATADNPTVSTIKGTMLTPRKSDDHAKGTTTVEVQENAVLDVQSGFWAGPSDYSNSIEKTGAGTLQVSGVFALNEGSLIIDEGTVILSGYAGGTITAAGATNTYGFASAVTVASGASLNMCFAEDTSISGTTFSGAGTIEKSGETKLTIDGYTFGGTTTVSEGTLVLTGSTEVIDVHVTSGATLDLTSASKSAQNGNGSLYIDGEGSTVIIANGAWGSGSNFGANMNNCYLQISNGGVLEVTEAQSATGSGYRGFAIMEGEGTYRYSGEGTSYIAENSASDSGPQKLHIADGATLIFDVVNEDATLEVSKLIAKSYNGDTPEYTTGSLVKIGAGTVILSNESNLYSGGTTIKEGVLVAASSGALGSGAVSIEGGQLSINSDVTITNNIEVTLSETYLVMDSLISPTSLGSGTLEPYAADNTDDGIYAITGTGSLGSSSSQVTITLFIDDTIAELLAEAGETGLGFYLLDAENISTDSSFTVSLSEALSSYTATYDATTGIVWIVGAATPEPSMFGMIFGLSALGLVATRRRRRKVA